MMNVSGSKMEDDIRQEDHVYDLVECNELRRFEIVWLKANSQRDDDSLVTESPIIRKSQFSFRGEEFSMMSQLFFISSSPSIRFKSLRCASTSI